MANITKVIMIIVITQSLSLGYSSLNATFSCNKQMHVCPRGDLCVCVYADICMQMCVNTDVCILQMCVNTDVYM